MAAEKETASQLTALTASATSAVPSASTMVALTASATSAVPSTSTLVALSAFIGPRPEYSEATQLSAQTAWYGEAIPRATQAVALVAYGTGVREILKQRAWVFDQDGHSLYVLSLGEQGTLVYDFLTEQWAQWTTEGYPVWNAELGFEWQGKVLAGDNQNPTLWRVDPTKTLDEDFKPLRRVAGSVITARGRDGRGIGEVIVYCSSQTVQKAEDEDVATMSLKYSDDGGNTYFEHGSVTLSASDFDQKVSFRALGMVTAPGRVFEFEDVGGPIRIQGAWVRIQGEDD